MVIKNRNMFQWDGQEYYRYVLYIKSSGIPKWSKKYKTHNEAIKAREFYNKNNIEL